MTDWTTWRAGPEEEDALIRLEREAFGTRSWGDGGLEGVFAAAGLTVLFGGETRDAALGFALWRDLSCGAGTGDAEILTIGVVPAARRRGLGAALLCAMTMQARDAGCAALFLEADAGNAAALALYNGRGFQEVGRRPGYYRDGADALVMKLVL